MGSSYACYEEPLGSEKDTDEIPIVPASLPITDVTIVPISDSADAIKYLLHLNNASPCAHTAAKKPSAVIRAICTCIISQHAIRVKSRCITHNLSLSDSDDNV
jgi:hypothetical protein